MTLIRKLLCPASLYPVKCPFKRTPTRIVVHNTANDAPAENEIQYMLNRPEEVSFHYAVDHREAVQALPLDRNAWASGDGRGPGNMEGIHIEICYSLSGGPRFDRAEQNAALLIAALLREYGWGLDKVTKHQDYDGKYCPHRTLDSGWERFLHMVSSCLEEDAMLSYEEFLKYMEQYERELAKKKISAWAQEAVDFCKKQALMVGDEAGGFRPRSLITRQEAAQLAANLYREIMKE